MSRVSLRLDEGLLDRSLPHSSSSFSAGGGGGGGSWRSNRSAKSRRSQQLSVSCSESLLIHTPPPSAPLPGRRRSSRAFRDSSVHSVASDASLLSSLLDESSVQDVTLVDSMWGLDHGLDTRENTIIAEQSTMVANSTLIGLDGHGDAHAVQTLSRVYRSDCDKDSAPSANAHAPKHSIATSKHAASATTPLTGPQHDDHQEPETSIVYHRERSRKTKTGILPSRAWEAALSACRWVVACVVSLLSLLNMQLQRRRRVTEVLQQCVRNAADCCVSVFAHTRQLCQQRFTSTLRGAHLIHGGGMKVSSTTTKESSPNGSLCEDCQEKQRSDTDLISSCSSLVLWLLVLMWNSTLVTGQTAAEAFRWLRKNWSHATTSHFLSRFSLQLFIFSLPLLLFLGLFWFGSAGLLTTLNLTAWRSSPVVPDITTLSSIFSPASPQNPPAEGPVDESTQDSPHYSSPMPVKEEETNYFSSLEQRLTALLDRMEEKTLWVEQRHGEVLRMHADFQQQVTAAQSGNKEEVNLGPWLSGVLDHQVTSIRRQLDQERQIEQQNVMSRLNKLELQLQTLVTKTEDFQRRAPAPAPAPTSLPVSTSICINGQSHDALLAELRKLEAGLENLKQDVQVLSDVKDDHRLLDTFQETISSQVLEEFRALIYGNQLMAVESGDSGSSANSESLLQWLSQQYVSNTDFEAALASLELEVLQNVSLQLEQQQQRRDERVNQEATTSPVGTITEDDVQVMVKNALLRFSQDQTGLADFALESGGGSIISTRCSENYQTNVALLSLFGVPLWYFSQSPRVVIQPDVHPGNCWAFQGSTGFLVIRLSMRILPTAFTLEHMPKALAPSGTLRSAPRDFRVYGLEDEYQEKGKLLGVYVYDQDGDALQTYTITEENEETFQIIEVQVLSNWGNEEYTCMYRFRVHGKPQGAANF